MDRTVANELGHGLSSKLTASRKWRRFSTTSVEDHNAFRLMTWNILAPGNIDPAHYPGIERWALDWEHRRCVILDEIVAQNSDIIVLQEVGSLEFNSYLKPELKKRGYECQHVPKTATRYPQPPSVTAANGVSDGIATFWRVKRFKLIASFSIPFQIGGVLDRPQVGSLTVLEDLIQQECLIVVNTHLLFNPKRGDIKLGQLLVLMRALFTVFQQYSTTRTVVTPSSLSDTSNRDNKALGVEAVEFTNTPAILFIGDFNITPASQIYEWLRRGQFDFSTMNDEAQKRISGQYLMQINKHLVGPAEYRGYGATNAVEDSSSRCTIPGWLTSVLESIGAVDLFMRPSATWKVDSTSTCRSFIASSDGTEPRSAFTLPDKNNGRQQNAEELALAAADGIHESCMLYHPFNLKSAYAVPSSSSKLGCEPLYTVFHGWQKGCVDYIWYSPNELQVDRILELPHQDILHKIGSIPNTSFGGSDHINLVAEFSFTRKSARHAPVFLRSLEGDFRALIRY